LLREGKFHLIPVYYLLKLSDLSREGIANSGSYMFAEHIYRNQPSGLGPLGRWLDARLLSSLPARAFRRRCLRGVEEMRLALESLSVHVNPVRVLSIPCGLPRDLAMLAGLLKTDGSQLLQRIEYHGMDIDLELLSLAERYTAKTPVASKRYHHGDALLSETFPPGPFHFVISTGLNEFLAISELAVFVRNVFDRLAEGGTFFTSATQKEPRSDALMRAFELLARYHSINDLEQVLDPLPWRRLKLVQDRSGLQTFVIGVK
jgi:hypothetical protein